MKLFADDRLHRSHLLLIDRSGTKCLVLNTHREGETPIFVFGQLVGINAFAPKNLFTDDQEEFVRRIMVWLEHTRDGEILVDTTSVLDPKGRKQWVKLTRLLPISDQLWLQAREVGWDMMADAAPIDLLEKETEQFRKEMTTSEPDTDGEY